MGTKVETMTPERLKELAREHQLLNPKLEIRQDILDGMNGYAEHGHEPGRFLRAVLENNLMEAMGRADSYNRASLYQITSYLYNQMPSGCWGSPEKVNSWLKRYRDEQS